MDGPRHLRFPVGGLFARVLLSVLNDTSQLAFKLSGQCRSSTEFGFPRNVTAELLLHLAHLVCYSPQLSIHLRFRLPLGHSRVFDRFRVNLQTHPPACRVQQNRCRSWWTKLSGLTFAIWFSQTVKEVALKVWTDYDGGILEISPAAAAALNVAARSLTKRPFYLFFSGDPEGAGPRRPWSRRCIQRGTKAARAQGHPCANHAGTRPPRGHSVDDHAAVTGTDSADCIVDCSSHPCGVAAIDEQWQHHLDCRSAWRHCDCVGQSHCSCAFGQRRNSRI